ncbi:hypothetical protein PG993_013460 [Apiospora rasikravindrae]|uniref:C2H2-type domain-containing protein n=1 Tax=Apiospora rasikravindrae TaxID=990691 RepID=A0ABR1RXV7_9PEZI
MAISNSSAATTGATVACVPEAISNSSIPGTDRAIQRSTRKFDYNVCENHASTMQSLVQQGSLDLPKLLEECASPLARNRLLRIVEVGNLVALAVERGQTCILQDLLQAGVTADGYDESPRQMKESGIFRSPLCIALWRNQTDIVRVLLKYGASFGLAKKLFHDAGMSDMAERLSTVALGYYLTWTHDMERITELRFRFNREYNRISPGIRRFAPVDTRWDHTPDSVFNELEIALASTCAEDAWDESLEILQKACRGVLPRTANKALIFIVLLKTMASSIDEAQGSRLEHDLLPDLNRWSTIPDWHPAEQAALVTAVLGIWEVDIRLQTPGSKVDMTDARARKVFSNMLQQFQDMANILVERSHDAFTDPNPYVQSAVTIREARFCQNSAEDSNHQEGSDPELARPTEPPDRKLGTLPAAVYLVMAGVGFTVIFASLILFCAALEGYNKHWRWRHEVAASIVAGDNPVARGSTHGYIAAQIIERTYLLLALLLGFLVTKPPDNVAIATRTLLCDTEDPGSHMTEYVPLFPPDVHEYLYRLAETPNRTPTGVASQPSSALEDPNPGYECRYCFYTCSELGRLNRHTKEQHEKVRYPCSAPSCKKSFTRKDYREKHERKQHGGFASQPPSLPAAYRHLPVVGRVASMAASRRQVNKRPRKGPADDTPMVPPRDGDSDPDGDVVVFRFPCDG